MPFAADIQAELVKLIGNTIGSDVERLIKENIEKAMGPAQKAQVDMLEAMFKGQAKPAEPTKEDASTGIAQMLFAATVGKGDPSRAAEFAKKQGYYEGVQKALAATDPTAGGFLVPVQYSTDIITYLRPQSVVRQLGPVVLPMPTGTLRIPKVTGGTSASYVGENTNMTKTQTTFGQITLTHKKLAALVPISNDLIRFSSPGAVEIVRDDLVRALAQRENQAFIRDDGTGAGPRGLRYWVNTSTNLLAAATTSLANVAIDMGKMIKLLMAASVPFTRPGWIFSPRSFQYLSTVQTTVGNFAFRDELMRGTFWNWPYKVSPTIPETLTDRGGTDETEVYLADFADVALGEADQLIIDASADAAYYDGSSVVAAFSQDQTVVRAIALHDLAVRRDVSLAVLNGVRWGA